MSITKEKKEVYRKELDLIRSDILAKTKLENMPQRVLANVTEMVYRQGEPDGYYVSLKNLIKQKGGNWCLCGTIISGMFVAGDVYVDLELPTYSENSKAILLVYESRVIYVKTTGESAISVDKFKEESIYTGRFKTGLTTKLPVEALTAERIDNVFLDHWHMSDLK